MSYTVIATNPRRGYDFIYEREALDPIDAQIVSISASSEQEYAQAVAGADALMPGPRVRITAPVIEAMSRCKIIANGGIGVDPVDVEAATARGIVVSNVPDLFVDEVADQAFALMLAAHRKVVHCHAMTSAGRWSEVYPTLGSIPKLRGATLGLIAFGNIARQVAVRAKAFGLRVVAFDPFVKPEAMAEQGVESRTLDELVREADLISAHAPLTKDTFHLVGEPQFRAMKNTAIFVNTGRGKVVDEPALIRALQEGWIGGAALDVLEQEPPDPKNPLLQMDNVIVTPHMASYSNEANIARRRRVGQDIAAVLQGGRPSHFVNPDVYAGARA
ncbi:MAG: C-terminal binding protein [Chloroflexi bacterium]|nr:C-terminal binding protein [Chloroflexota bacterium]MBV9542920.1 C-terminal binding protein [Chloroflexota bacterium]